VDFFEVVHTQRSIRRFKPDPVPDEAIWTMIDAAIRAPSGGNTQPWAWLVVRDAAEDPPDPALVDRSQVVDERIRSLGETALAPGQLGIERPFARRAGPVTRAIPRTLKGA